MMLTLKSEAQQWELIERMADNQTAPLGNS